MDQATVGNDRQAPCAVRWFESGRRQLINALNLFLEVVVIFYPPFLKRGITLAPWLILIPLWAKTDKAYLAHEQKHAAQQRLEGALRFWFKYLRSPQYRQAVEVEAYKTQIAHGATVVDCAHQLSTGYKLDLNMSQAWALLTK